MRCSFAFPFNTIGRDDLKNKTVQTLWNSSAPKKGKERQKKTLLNLICDSIGITVLQTTQNTFGAALHGMRLKNPQSRRDERISERVVNNILLFPPYRRNNEQTNEKNACIVISSCIVGLKHSNR